MARLKLNPKLDRARRTQLKRAGITCVCYNLRKASRVVTRIFDQHLEEAGLSSTQFQILGAIARHDNLSISQLAELMLMDRTTLTRNLKPMEKARWIRPFDEGEDRRRRSVQLTAAGERTLEKAMPLWERAQEDVLARAGDENTKALLVNLWRFIYGKRYLGA